jgi:hypothetical protein
VLTGNVPLTSLDRMLSVAHGVGRDNQQAGAVIGWHP